MSKVIKSLQDLMDVGCKVKHGTKLEINGMKMTVSSSYLLIESGSNEEIFDELDLDKKSFCKKAYGYEPSGGDCPSCDDEDYKALARLATALFVEAGQFVTVEETDIEITVKVNGKETKLSDVSEETLLKIRKNTKG